MTALNKSNFKCDKCGLCCKSLQQNSALDFLNRGDGTCMYFNEKENLCTIYNERPLLCRVDEGYILFKDYMSKKQYYNLNQQSCEKLKSTMN
ncbi:TPA: YkgJ family cysteine cluster protein [Vibrio parahaemolyticus]|nr:YkgJ family cysteine cluster protein [Vibrio parahaemolyticus]